MVSEVGKQKVKRVVNQDKKAFSLKSGKGANEKFIEFLKQNQPKNIDKYPI